ncbi:MAG: magnesium transporter [Bacteroidetes bacterium]|nr:magnesium transporter [Bacteroidota bacterium]
MSQHITKEKIDEIREAIEANKVDFLLAQLEALYPADIAEIINQIEADEAKYLMSLLHKEEAAEVLMELEEDVREDLISSLTSMELARDVIDNLDSDDAADLINELPGNLRQDVLSKISDRNQAQNIADLLFYPENTAGSLMAKELVKVNISWHVVTCIREMRAQAANVDKVYQVYVVDDDNVLVGMLSLERLLIASPRDKISDLYEPDVISVKAYQKAEEVASIMKKYDLVALPVVDEIGRLIGRITIDDVLDFVQDEAEKDYQLMSGISHDIEASDKVWELTRGRLFWLVVALFGGILGSRVIANYEDQISIYPEMAFFMPLIAAMAGNVGVQSSALIVQALASNSLSGSLLSKLGKELTVGLINGLVCSALLLAYSFFYAPTFALSMTVSVALLTVILFASIFGTFVPLALNKLKIDPALATGPFITTSNDIVGLFIYFSIGRLMYGMFA